MEENKRTIEEKLYIALSALDEDMAKYSFFQWFTLLSNISNADFYSEILKMEEPQIRQFWICAYLSLTKLN